MDNKSSIDSKIEEEAKVLRKECPINQKVAFQKPKEESLSDKIEEAITGRAIRKEGVQAACKKFIQVMERCHLSRSALVWTSFNKIFGDKLI